MLRKSLLATVAIVVAFGAQAQSSLTSTALKGAATSLLSQTGITTSSITGKWTYTTPGVKMSTKSEEGTPSLTSMLKNAGGSAASSVVESKLGEYLTKIGIKEGLISMEFNEDGTFVMPVKGKNVNGKYTYDESTKALKLTIVGLNINGTAEVTASTLKMLFSVEKFTSLISTLATSCSSSSLATIASFLKQYEDIEAGLAFKKAE